MAVTVYKGLRNCASSFITAKIRLYAVDGKKHDKASVRKNLAA